MQEHRYCVAHTLTGRYASKGFMKELLLLVLTYVIFYGMTFLDRDLSELSHKVGVVNIKSVNCYSIGRTTYCQTIFSLGSEPGLFTIDADISSNFDKEGFYFNRKVEVLSMPQLVAEGSGPSYVSHITRNGYSIYGSTKWLSKDDFYFVNATMLLLFALWVLVRLKHFDKKHNKLLKSDS